MTPDFRELIGDDVPEEERARLERVHELLIEAGPPPELPPAIADLSGEPETVVVLPRRRAGAMIALAAAIALVAFVGGYAAAHHGNGTFSTFKSLPMHGTAAAQNASASSTLDSKPAKDSMSAGGCPWMRTWPSIECRYAAARRCTAPREVASRLRSAQVTRRRMPNGGPSAYPTTSDPR